MSTNEFLLSDIKVKAAKKLLSSTPSLCNLPPTWQHLTLKEMKRLAVRANAPSSWQSIRRKRDMIACLEEKVDDYTEFLVTVQNFSFEAYLEMGISNLEGNRRKKRRKRIRRENDMEIGRCEDSDILYLEDGVRPSLEAAVHFVPSGSGVYLGRGLILTCCHCVNHDDDDDDSDNNDDSENRIGRIVETINARGQTFGSICIDACSHVDLAILQIPQEELENVSLTSLDLAKRGSDKDGIDIFALGNPCDTDLETSDEGNHKRSKNGFYPFCVSQGKLEGKISAEEANIRGLGRLIHSSWTYWGHSGCPLVSVMKQDGKDTACIVGIHNSWDDCNGNRHGIPLDEIWSFLCRKGLFIDTRKE
mmetsp:Transcript_5729/g.7049  ORF Transcript_5729/g.7049 Transcript_5729/m.7049 type:complete len:362 (-) Transcript_5729:27-1112(-)